MMKRLELTDRRSCMSRQASAAELEFIKLTPAWMECLGPLRQRLQHIKQSLNARNN